MRPFSISSPQRGEEVRVAIKLLTKINIWNLKIRQKQLIQK